MRLTLVHIVFCLLATFAGVCTAQIPKTFDAVTLERTPCFGACPSYTVEIRSNGEVRFNGKKDVAAKGEKQGKVSSSDLEFLGLAIRRADFYRLKDSYAKESDGCKEVWTDNPSLVITVTSGATTKSVRYYFGCRGPLVLSSISWLADTIDEVAGTSKWVGPQLLKDS